MADFRKNLIQYCVKTTKYLFKILLLYLFLTVQYPFNIFADEKPLVKEIVVNKQDSVFRHTFYFDDNRNKVIENKFYMKDFTPYPVSRTEWIYQANNCISQREQKWNNADWSTTYLINAEFSGNVKALEKYILVVNNVEITEKTITYTYENSKIKSIVKYKGQIENNDVEERILYDYDDRQNIRLQQIIPGDVLQSDSILAFRYVYNLSGKTDSVIMFRIQQAVEYNEDLTTFVYDKNTGNLLCQTQKKWNDASARWDNLTKTEYLYDDSDKLVEEMYYFYNILFWIPNTKYEYIYDSNGKLGQKIMYQPIYRQWRKIFTIEYSKIENGQPNLMESKYNFWGGETGSYVNNFIPYYFNDEIAIMKADRMELKYFMETTVISKNNFDSEWFKIYPNPSNGVFYIDTQNFYVEKWEVYNLSGLMIKNNFNHFHTGVVDLTEFPDGIYMIIATTNDNKQLKQKLLINRNK